MSLGLYIHVPFCKSKCAYCDFYSFSPDNEQVLDDYTQRTTEELEKWAARVNCAADTLYFGGGTPSLLGGHRLAKIVNAAKKCFGLKNAEITVECNPGDKLFDDFCVMASAGVNRISIGAQSAVDSELKALSRRHTSKDIETTVFDARRAGIKNISVDVMLGIPYQTEESLVRTLDFFTSLTVEHISAYILKVESGTPMEKMVHLLPSEDTVAELYLKCCNMLEEKGFQKYEISNFSKMGFESRHNLKYWSCEEYLGIGPAAHSFLNGNRFYYDRSINDFLNGEAPRLDGAGGDIEEYIMLKLRLTEGVNTEECAQKFGPDFKEKFETEAEKLIRAGLMVKKQGSYSLTHEGALVSNECIVRLLGDI